MRKIFLQRLSQIIFIVCFQTLAFSTAFGATNYRTEVIVKVDVPPAGGLGRGLSINDQGKIAFISYATWSRGKVIIVNNGVLERIFPSLEPFTIQEFVQINNSDQVIFHDASDDGLVTNVIRLDTADSGEVIAIGSRTPRLQGHFDEVLPWATLNDNGRGVISAIRNIDHTVLATRVGGVGDHNVSDFLLGLPELFPMVSNDNRTVVRMGGDQTAPIVLWLDSNTVNLALPEDFNAMGQKPGISDDGQVMAFLAKDKNNDAAVHASFVDQLPGVTFPVTDISDNSNIDLRVGINHSPSGKNFEYTVAYLANSSTNGRLGLYAIDVDVSDRNAPQISQPVLITEVGKSIDPLPGTLQDISVYDPINNQGQIAFWARTESSQAIVRATPVIPEFIRSDSNGDGATNIADVLATLNYLFLRQPSVKCVEAADANDDGEVDISDPVYTLFYLFAGGKQPRAPFPNQGPDPTPDNLGCTN